MKTTPQSKLVLLVDPDRSDRERLSSQLLRVGAQVQELEVLADAAEQLARRPYDAVIVALDALGPNPAVGTRELVRTGGGAPLLVICEPARACEAVKLLRHGVEDYLLRPPDAREVRARVVRILERSELASRIDFFQDEVSKKHGLSRFEARSPGMQAVLDRVLRVAPMRSTVLVYGESGVGKELVARAIHFNSPRRRAAFVAINCAAIPANLIESELFGHEKGAFTGAHARARGKFEIAHRGTLFLDEIGEMGPATQAKLLRVLEAREFMRVGGDQNLRVDVRVIAATNANLDDLVSASRFRQDLYYRLKVVTLTVPPLRRRREDLPHLVETFLDQLSRVNAVPPKSIVPDAMDALLTYAWPGNVRELKNLVESLLVSVPGKVIRLEDLPTYVHRGRTSDGAAALDPGTTLVEMERELIRRTLEYTGGNRTHAASLLAIGVRTLQRKIRTYDLSIAPKRRRKRTRATGV